MTELIEKFLTDPSTAINNDNGPFALELQEFMYENSIINPKTKSVYCTYMFLGSLLSLPFTGIMNRINMKNMVIKFDDKVINAVYVLNGGTDDDEDDAKLVFRTIAMVRDYEPTNFTHEELNDIVRQLELEYYIVAKAEIDWKVLSLSENTFTFRKIPGESLKHDIELITKTNFKQLCLDPANKPQQPGEFISMLLKISDADDSEKSHFRSMFTRLGSGNIEIVKASAVEIFKKIHSTFHLIGTKFPYLNVPEAHEGFIAGLFILNVRSRYLLKCSVQKSLSGIPLLKAVSEIQINKKATLSIPIIVDIDLSTSELFLRNSHVLGDSLDFMSSSETDVKWAVLVSPNFSLRSTEKPTDINVVNINQGIIFNVLRHYDILFNAFSNQEVELLLANELKYTYSQIANNKIHMSSYLFGQIVALDSYIDNQPIEKYEYKHHDPDLNQIVKTFLIGISKRQWLAINILEAASTRSTRGMVDSYLSSAHIPTIMVDHSEEATLMHIDFLPFDFVNLSIRKTKFKDDENTRRYGKLVRIDPYLAKNFSELNTNAITQFQSSLSNVLFDHQHLISSDSHFRVFLKGSLTRNFLLLSKFEEKPGMLAFMKNDLRELKVKMSLSINFKDSLAQENSIFKNSSIVLIKCGFALSGNVDVSVIQNADNLQVDYATGVAFSKEESVPDLLSLLFVPRKHFGDSFIIEAQMQSALQIGETGLHTYNAIKSSISCLQVTRQSSLAKRQECLFSWDDIHEVSADRMVTEVSEIKIDSKRFLKFSNTQSDKKVSQLCNFLIESGIDNEHSVIGEQSNEVITLINNEKVINTLRRIGEVSSSITQGIMVKDLLSDILRGNYKALEYNSLTIFANHMLPHAAKLVERKAIKIAISGNMIPMKMLHSTSPFSSRIAQSVNIYELIESIKLWNTGDNEDLIKISNVVPFLTIDASEIGLAQGETFGTLEEVMSAFGLISTLSGTMIFLNPGVYKMVASPKAINYIHLTDATRYVKFIQSFAGLQASPANNSNQLEQINNLHLIHDGLKIFTKFHSIKNYFFPTQKLVSNRWMDHSDNTILLTERTEFTSVLNEGIPSSAAVLCFNNHLESKNPADFMKTASWWSLVFGSDFFEINSNKPKNFNLLPSYMCENSIGISNTKTVSNENDVSLIDLRDGNDFAIGIQQSANIFLLGNGYKNITGGDKDDFFILKGTNTRGILNGGKGGKNVVDLTLFAPNKQILNIVLSRPYSTLSVGKMSITLTNIEVVLGRQEYADHITCYCDTKLIDGHASGSNVDIIRIPDQLCPYNIQMRLSGNTEVYNDAVFGDFLYVLTGSVSSAKIFLNERNIRHKFMANFTLQDILSINQKWLENGSYVEFLIFNGINNKITIFNFNSNCIIVFKDGIRMHFDTNKHFYVTIDMYKMPEEIMDEYESLAEKLGIFVIVYSTMNNSTISIGHSNQRILRNSIFHSSNVIYNDPFKQSHLLGGNAASIYVIQSGHAKVQSVDDAQIPDVTIHGCQYWAHTNTLHFGKLQTQLRTDLQKELRLSVSKRDNDFIIEYSLNLDNGRTNSYFSLGKVIVKGAVKVNGFTEKFSIVRNGPMKITIKSSESDHFELIPVPLYFGNDTTSILITVFNIEPGNKIIIDKNIGNYKLIKESNSLILTNVNLDMVIKDENVCTIILKNLFLEPLLKQVFFEFKDKTIDLNYELEKIDTFDNFFATLEDYKNIQKKNFQIYKVFQDFQQEINIGE